MVGVSQNIQKQSGATLHMAMSQNPGTLGTLNRWFMPVYSPKYGSNKFWPIPISTDIDSHSQFENHLPNRQSCCSPQSCKHRSGERISYPKTWPNWKKSMAQRKAGCENSGWNWMELVIIWVLKMELHVIGKHPFSAGFWTNLFSNKLIRPSFLSS